MNNLHDIAKAGEFCLQEAILAALEQQPEAGLSVVRLTIALGISGTGCEKMVESHLKHRLKHAGKVHATRGPNPAWRLTPEERGRRRN